MNNTNKRLRVWSCVDVLNVTLLEDSNENFGVGVTKMDNVDPPHLFMMMVSMRICAHVVLLRRILCHACI